MTKFNRIHLVVLDSVGLVQRQMLTLLMQECQTGLQTHLDTATAVGFGCTKHGKTRSWKYFSRNTIEDCSS